jgi:hypothetical protein
VWTDIIEQCPRGMHAGYRDRRIDVNAEVKGAA